MSAADALARRLDPSARRVASLDAGSNTVLMLLAERAAEGAPWQRVEDHASITRVAEGLDASGVLSDAAVARTGDVLAGFGARARAWGADAIVATGTAPFRRSRNGAEAAAALSERLGAAIDVVSGETEAALALLATRCAFPGYAELLVVDIGGASTELIHARADGSSEVVSLDVGSVRLAERTLGRDAVDEAALARLDAAIDAALGVPAARALLGRGVGPVVGVAGTVTTAATVALALDAWDADAVHGAALSIDTIGDVFEKVRSVAVAARASIPGLEPKRADVFPAGARLLWAIARAAGAAQVIVSDRGIRWGRLHAVSGH